MTAATAIKLRNQMIAKQEYPAKKKIMVRNSIATIVNEE
jgi:hypothetical protein